MLFSEPFFRTEIKWDQSQLVCILVKIAVFSLSLMIGQATEGQGHFKKQGQWYPLQFVFRWNMKHFILLITLKCYNDSLCVVVVFNFHCLWPRVPPSSRITVNFKSKIFIRQFRGPKIVYCTGVNSYANGGVFEQHNANNCTAVHLTQLWNKIGWKPQTRNKLVSY